MLFVIINVWMYTVLRIVTECMQSYENEKIVNDSFYTEWTRNNFLFFCIFEKSGMLSFFLWVRWILVCSVDNHKNTNLHYELIVISTEAETEGDWESISRKKLSMFCVMMLKILATSPEILMNFRPYIYTWKAGQYFKRR